MDRPKSLAAALFPATIENASRIRFYRDWWQGFDVSNVREMLDLPKLPTLDKAQYRHHFMRDFDDDGTSHFISHSTGTTGAVTVRQRSLIEAAVIDRVFSYVKESSPDGVPVLGLAVTSSYHGMAMPIPGNSVELPVGARSDTEIRQCLDLLNSEFRIHSHLVKPSRIAGQGVDVALIAQAVLESGLDRRQLAIERVVVGGYLDDVVQHLVASTFEAAIIERYSLSEIFGGATRRPGVSFYMLDEHVVGEVVAEDGMPVDVGGVGELTLSELFPFVQLQPLIRYRTGDIVQRVEGNNEQLAFQWWGRRRDCVGARVDGVHEWLLGYRHVAEVLAEWPDVERRCPQPHPSHLARADVGAPRFTLEMDRLSSTINVRIAVRFNPWLHPRRLDDMRAELSSRLQSPNLERNRLRIDASFEQAPERRGVSEPLRQNDGAG